MSSVILAALALTVWFFLLAGSPIPNQEHQLSGLGAGK